MTDLLAARALHSPATRARPVTAATMRAAAARARSTVVSYARSKRGAWYQYGAAGPSRFDCSGITLAAYRRAGIGLPHSSHAQGRRGVRVSSRNARPGDLVYWRSGHVAVLVGKWRMVDAPGRGRQVQERAVYRSGSPQFRRLIG